LREYSTGRYHLQQSGLVMHLQTFHLSQYFHRDIDVCGCHLYAACPHSGPTMIHSNYITAFSIIYEILWIGG